MDDSVSVDDGGSEPRKLREYGKKEGVGWWVGIEPFVWHEELPSFVP